MVFYGLKTCDTCRKAQKDLAAAGVSFTGVDIRADGVCPERLSQWVETLGWQKLLNTRSTTWRNLPDTDRQNIHAGKAVRLMSQNPALIKRPVIEKEDHIHVGWTVETKSVLL